MVTSCLTARIVSVYIQQTPVYVPFPEWVIALYI
jgi:hypothetical protein